jgi:hypothetical protein
MIMATLAGFEEMGGADAPLSERIAFAVRAVDVIMSGVAAW